MLFFFFSSRRRHTRCYRDWSSDVCSSDLDAAEPLRDLLQRGYELAAVVQRRRDERRDEFAALGQEPERVRGDLRFDRRTTAPIGEQLVERNRIEDRARDAVIAD